MNKLLKISLIAAAIFMASIATFAQKTKEYTDNATKFEHAKMLYVKKQYVPAIKEFKQFLKTTPGPNFTYEANAYVGLSRLKLDKANAARDLANFLRHEPEHKLNTEISYELGLYYFNKGRYSRALKYLEDIKDTDISKAQREELTFKKGYSYFKGEEYENAKNEFRKIMNGSGRYAVEANYYYGYQCYILKDYTCALATFEKIGDKGPKTMKLYISQIYYEKANYEKAFEIIRDLKIEKRANEIELLKGKIQYQLGNKSIALNHFQKYTGNVASLSPDEIYQFANAYFEAGKYKKSTEYFLLISNEENEIGQASNYHLGVSDVKSDKKERALNAFAEAKRKKYNKEISEIAAFNYAKLAAELQKNSVAINSIKQFLQEYPNSKHEDEAKSMMADIFLSTKNYKAAIEVLEDIDQLNNSTKVAYQELTFHRGEELYLNKQYQDANVFFNKSLKYPKDKTLEALAYFWRAEIAYKVDDYDESIKLMNRFVSNSGSELSKNKTYGYYAMGYNYFKKKDYSRAQNYFAKYSKNETYTTENKTIYLDNTQRLADCYFLTRMYNEAIKEYDFIIKKNYKNSDYSIFQKGMLYGLQERHSEKINTLKLIQKDFPKSVYIDDALYQIAREYMALENYSMAESIFNVIISQHDYSQFLPDSYLKLGLINYNQKKDEVALRYYKTVVERFPKTSASKEALSFIEVIYSEQGKTEEYFDYVKNVPGANVSVSYQDSAIYESAMTRYRAGDCIGATTTFKSYITKFGSDGYFIVPVNYYKAECDYYNDRQDDALKHYQFVVSQSRNEFTEKSLNKLSSTYYNRKDYSKALEYYQALEPVASSKTTFLKSLLGQMRCHYELGNSERAKKKAIEILPIENVPKENLVEANMTLGRIQLKDNNMRSAKFHFDYVIKESRNVQTAEALYQRAFILYHQDDLDSSRSDIYRLNDDFSVYEYWVVKGFVLLSDIYVKEKDYFQAKATLQSILDNYKNYTDGILDECNKKLKEVEKLENPDPNPNPLIDEEE
jgi:tetratricopeptide (TPR) repeat protein